MWSSSVRQVQGEVVAPRYSKWPSSGGEEVELEVLRTLVTDVLSVDHHPQMEVPLRDLQVEEEERI